MGDDVPDNLINMCRKCHSLQHQIGWVKMCEKYPLLKRVLKLKGWEIVEEFGLKKLRRK